MENAEEAAPWSTDQGQWVLFRSIPSVGRDEDFQGGLDLAVEVDFPPRSSRLTVPQRISPDRKAVDNYPMIVAGGRDGRLLLFTTQGPDPEKPIVDGFYTEPIGGDVCSRFGVALYILDIRRCAAVRMPDPPVRILSASNIGFIDHGPSSVVVELRPVGINQTSVLCYSSLNSNWVVKMANYPLGDRAWRGDGVITDGGNIFWIDLSVGLLTCRDVDWTTEESVLLTHISLPEDCILPQSRNYLHNYRCVALSAGFIRYVEIFRRGEDAKVLIGLWTLVNQQDNLWHLDNTMLLEDIWNSSDYIESGLPQAIPAVALIHPENPSIVYFIRQGKIYSVDIVQGNFIACHDFQMSQPPKECHSSAFIRPWKIPHKLFNDARSDRLGPHELEYFSPPHIIPLFLRDSLPYEYVRRVLKKTEAPYIFVEGSLEVWVHSVMSTDGAKGFSGVVVRESDGSFVAAQCFAADAESIDLTGVFAFACERALYIARSLAMVTEHFQVRAVIVQSDQFNILEELVDAPTDRVGSMMELLSRTRHVIARISHESNDAVILARRARDENTELDVVWSFPGKMPWDWLDRLQSEAGHILAAQEAELADEEGADVEDISSEQGMSSDDE